MTVFHTLLPVLLVSAVGKLQDDYDIEQLDTSTTTTTADFEAFPLWLDEEDTEISIPEQSLCPPPYPIEEKNSSELCNRTICSHSGNCSNSKANETLICCFNGCVQTCMHPLKPPLAFDWIEETAELRKVVEPEPSPSAHSSGPEMMVLKDGCFMSPNQWKSLQLFKQNEHVSHCFCEIGSVFCKINER